MTKDMALADFGNECAMLRNAFLILKGVGISDQVTTYLVMSLMGM